jgi:IS1 family transposase
LKKLWNKVSDINEVWIVYTDGNPAYKEVFENDIDVRHLVTKLETCLVESYNSAICLRIAAIISGLALLPDNKGDILSPSNA